MNGNRTRPQSGNYFDGWDVQFTALRRIDSANPEELSMKHSFAWLTPLLVIAAGILLLSFQAPQALNADLATATYSRGVLHAIIPYISSRAGAGRLTVEVLDPEDQTLARLERDADIDGSKGDLAGGPEAHKGAGD
jgi:hypothetical protein